MSAGRLAFGEHTTPEAAQAFARLVFLSTVAELVPDVLATLRDDVLPVYAATYDEVTGCADAPDVAAERVKAYEQEHGGRVILCRRPYDVSRWQVIGSAHVSEDLARYPDLLPLREALEAWSTSHHLHEPWVHENALLQLDLWREYPTHAYPRAAWPRQQEQSAGPDRLRWLGLTAAGPGSALQQHEHRFTFEHVGWDPTWCTWQEAERAIRSDFEQRLREYRDAMRTRVAAADGFERSNPKRSLQPHMAWLVRYHVKREPWPAIAASSYTTQGAVEKAVNEYAELLGLTLDPVRGPGRPPGSTTKNTTGNRVTREFRRP